MPVTDMHRRKRSKNLFALGVLCLFVAGLFYLSVIKLSGA